MKKKVFTILLLAVFMLAQFSFVSAAPDTGATITFGPLSTFSNATNIQIPWKVTGMAATATQNLLIWSRVQDLTTPAVWSIANCRDVTSVSSLTDASGTFTFTYGVVLDQQVIEFTATVDDAFNCAGAAPLASTIPAMGSTFIDAILPTRITLNPPSLDTSPFEAQRVACNTFEMWSLGSDNWIAAPPPVVPVGGGYSGLKSWNQLTTGVFAPPTPLGTAPDLLSWQYTFPATASGGWMFSLQLTDTVGNSGPVRLLRDPALLTNILPSELENCKDFSDTAGNANAIYIRYLADLGLISGNPDGTSGINKTLTRAEATALFEKANNYTPATLPVAPSAACTFTDVKASDWFSGWVWQACADGFMSGIGGGKFDPSNTLTRGQVVTILNNIDVANNGTAGSFLAPFTATYRTILNSGTAIWTIANPIRTLAWTDVFISDYYAIPIQRAYGWGVADATGPTTFSPNQPILRGEFEKMMYRALSRVP